MSSSEKNSTDNPPLERNSSISTDASEKFSPSKQLKAKDKKIHELSKKLARQTSESQHFHKLQQALYKISELASGAEELDLFYSSIHQIISQLLYAENFYIALLNDEGTALELIYFVDSKDDYSPAEGNLFSIALKDKTLSTYLFKQKKTLLLSANEILKLQEKHLVNPLGTSARSWLGAPLIVDSRPLGVIVVQSYTNEFIFEDWHKALFDYVSHSIASTFERKQYRMDLEIKVNQRTEKLQNEVNLRKQRQKIESVLLKISELANSPISLSDFYKKLHSIIAGLIYAENFYIALTDTKVMKFVYYEDSRDDTNIEQIDELSVASSSSGMTAYLIRKKESFLSNNQEIEALAELGEIDLQGPESQSWLGIPLVIDENIIGVMVLQSYRTDRRFNKQDQLLMEYISKPVATAIHRKTSQQKLELLVDYRTAELDKSNRELLTKIEEKIKAEKLQRALYDIANLASGAEDMCTFYQSIHHILGSLFYAENFYIALADSNNQLVFEYFSDLKDKGSHLNKTVSNPHGSLSVQLYNSDKPMLLNWEEYLELADKNQLELIGSQFVSWLGVPLIEKQRTVGIMVLQSYRDDVVYNKWHLELLEYVSQQIATTLQRKKTKDNLEKLIQERTANLEREIEDHKKSRQTQSALYQIANLASMDIELNEFYKELHKIVAQLVYAENFYIALKDSVNNAIEMVYYVDTMDDLDLESIASIPLESLRKSVTVYVMNSGTPLLADKTRMAALTLKEDLDVHGEHTVSWLGIPLAIDGNIIGVMALQSYIEDKRISEKDKELMIFVGQHVATALARNKSKDYLKLLVERRTQELTISNQKLHNEISQKKYSENIQTALFRISEAPQEFESYRELYARLHEIVSQLMYAKSFYIALVDREKQHFNFDYVVDDVDKSVPKSIPIGESLTGYVYHQKKIVHINRKEIEQLENSGKIKIRGSYPIDWVGVPLLSGSTIFGILIVQSYDDNNIYSNKDVEVLNFVSTHIADALDRTRAKKKLELVHKELAEKSRKAEAASEAKSSFLATVSHEIRTPMNGILGMLALVADTELTIRQQDYISKISLSANSLLGIINDILDYSKIEEGKLELESFAFDLSDLLDNLVDVFSGSITEKQLALNVDLEPDVNLSRIGDPLRLSQILINLIGNAVKFTRKGFINIIIRAPSENRLLFLVQDSGIGIPENKRDKIFGSFTQADDTTTRKFGGSGLGLSICQQLVSLMDGWIKVTGDDGKGSCFSFEVKVNEGKVFSIDKPLYSEIAMLLISDDKRQQRSWRHFFERLQIKLSIISLQQLTEISGKSDRAYTHIFVDSHQQELENIYEYLVKLKLTVPCFWLSQSDSPLSEFIHSNRNILQITKPTKMSSILNIVQNNKNPINNAQANKQPNKRTRVKILGCRVLLAEDNLINQQVAKETLKQAGAVVTLVDNGLLAVEECYSNQFDIVLMDIQMPIMDGYQATVKIRNQFSLAQLPIIAMTANVMKGDQEKCLQHGMNDYISKPINRATFFATIEKYLVDKD